MRDRGRLHRSGEPGFPRGRDTGTVTGARREAGSSSSITSAAGRTPLRRPADQDTRSARAFRLEAGSRSDMRTAPRILLLWGLLVLKHRLSARQPEAGRTGFRAVLFSDGETMRPEEPRVGGGSSGFRPELPVFQLSGQPAGRLVGQCRAAPPHRAMPGDIRPPDDIRRPHRKGRRGDGLEGRGAHAPRGRRVLSRAEGGRWFEAGGPGGPAKKFQGRAPPTCRTSSRPGRDDAAAQPSQRKSQPRTTPSPSIRGLRLSRAAASSKATRRPFLVPVATW